MPAHAEARPETADFPVLALFRVDALGNDCGRLQNGAADTGKLNHFSVACGKASNQLRFPF